MAAENKVQLNATNGPSSRPTREAFNARNRVQRGISTDTIPDNTLNVEELAGMLARGEFPANYESIIANISDEDVERLWAFFKQKCGVMNEGSA